MKQALTFVFSAMLLIGFTTVAFAQEPVPAPAPSAPATQAAPPASSASPDKKSDKKGHS
jgi:hypothetical protein